jgi:hypothetical protein
MKRLAMAAALGLAAPALANPLAGEALHADVRRYVGHGDHLAGSPGAAATASWLERRLRKLGYTVSRQPVPVTRVTATSRLLIDGQPAAANAMWWPRPGRARLSAPVGPGGIALIDVAVKDQSYLPATLTAQIRAAAAAGAPAVLLHTATSLGADGPYRFNVKADDAPWPVPVLAIGSATAARVRASRQPVRITLASRATAAQAHNIIARLDRPGTNRVVVISTPYTGWGPCGGERGPGIALFLALAEWARANLPHDLLFVATAGHEIGHSGMATFLETGPAPASTALWLHLGASIATHASATSRAANSATRYALFSPGLAPVAQARFGGAFTLVPTNVAAFGEMADVVRAGYPLHLGFAGYGPHHHLPSDDASATDPALMADAATRLTGALATILASAP